MSSLYLKVMSALDKMVPAKFMPLWNHPAGPKTVFFWAPAIKWGLVGAGIGDLARPADQLSIPQSVALAATGCVWSSVNVFVAGTQLYQLFRAYKHQQNSKAKDVE